MTVSADGVEKAAAHVGRVRGEEGRVVDRRSRATWQDWAPLWASSGEAICHAHRMLTIRDKD